MSAISIYKLHEVYRAEGLLCRSECVCVSVNREELGLELSDGHTSDTFGQLQVSEYFPILSMY